MTRHTRHVWDWRVYPLGVFLDAPRATRAYRGRGGASHGAWWPHVLSIRRLTRHTRHAWEWRVERRPDARQQDRYAKLGCGMSRQLYGTPGCIPWGGSTKSLAFSFGRTRQGQACPIANFLTPNSSGD